MKKKRRQIKQKKSKSRYNFFLIDDSRHYWYIRANTGIYLGISNFRIDASQLLFPALFLRFQRGDDIIPMRQPHCEGRIVVLDDLFDNCDLILCLFPGDFYFGQGKPVVV